MNSMPSRWTAAVLLVSAVASSLVAGPADAVRGALVGVGVGGAGRSEPISTNLSRWSGQAIPVPAVGSPSFDVAVVLGGQTWHVVFELAPVHAPNAVLRVWDAAGPRDLPMPQPRTYVGRVDGRPGAIAAASIMDKGLRIIIDPADPAVPGNLWFVQPLAELAGAAAPSSGRSVMHAVYSDADLIAGDWTCGNEALGVDAVRPPPRLPSQSPPLSPPPNPPTSSGGYTPRVNCIKTADVVFDSDVEFYQLNGSSVPTTVADIESVMNVVNVIYARDAQIQHVITQTNVRTAEPDPYTATDPGGILNDLAAWWEANPGTAPRDMTHLMTGKPTGGIIGVAYVSAVCSYGYGWSQSRFTTNLAFRAGLTAHEMGHNWGAGHCDGDSDCFIMCSGIGGCSNDVTRFGTRSITDIRRYRDATACTVTSAGLGVPIVPFALADSAATVVGASVDLDPLANDADANCDVVHVGTYDSTASAGGKVSLFIGAGPSGRDVLRYRPLVGFSGTETFTYRAADSGGLLSRPATVTVNVLPMTPPVPAPLALAGLNVDYYHSYLMNLPDFATLTPLASQSVASINWPTSTNAIGNSGRSTAIASAYVGTIQLPLSTLYTFFTESDDGSALFIDGQLVVANDGPQGMTERSGTLSLAAGAHAFRVEHFQGGGNWGLIARVQASAIAKQVIPASYFPAGLTATYYQVGDDYTDIPNLATLPKQWSDAVAALDFPESDTFVASSGRTVHVVADFTGYFNAPADGLYQFSSSSDDGSRVFVDGVTIVENGGVHGTQERSGYAALRAGPHPFRVTYWQGGGGKALQVYVTGPGLARQVVAGALLSRPPATTDDCDLNGVSDDQQLLQTLDLGDIAVGGNGRGTGQVGRGLIVTSGLAVAPSAFGSSRGGGFATFFPMDGLSGRPNIPAVAGVFAPNGTTTIAPGLSVTLSPCGGATWDAIRNGGMLFEGAAVTPIRCADAPLASRPGLGMHANSGITFDLNAIRAANPSLRFSEVRGRAVFNQGGCSGGTSNIEFRLMLDGADAVRRIIAADALRLQPFSVPIPASVRYLTFVSSDGDGNNCDHLALADLVLVANSSADADADGRLDACCIADFDGSGGVPDAGDIAAFFAAWLAGDPSADVDGTGGTPDANDVSYFFQRWLAGC